MRGIGNIAVMLPVRAASFVDNNLAYLTILSEKVLADQRLGEKISTSSSHMAGRNPMT